VEAANPFAQTPLTPEPIIAQVRRELAADCGSGPCPAAADLDKAADAAVRMLWQGRVRTFVPVLALREAREMLHLQRGRLGPAGPVATKVDDGNGTGPGARDVLTWGQSDALPLDGKDRLRLRGDLGA
jgi:hypothetical protein